MDDDDKLDKHHNIKTINMNKLYAYEMYWLLRRRPVHCIVPVKNSMDLFFYNLKYGQYTPQSLELMIEAFLCGCNISR